MESSLRLVLMLQPPECSQKNICGVGGGGTQGAGGWQALGKLGMLVHDPHSLVKYCVSIAQYLPLTNCRHEENFELISNRSVALLTGAPKPEHI